MVGFTGIRDIDLEILSFIDDDKKLMQISSLNSYFRNLLESDENQTFWKNRGVEKYGAPFVIECGLSVSPSWETSYKKYKVANVYSSKDFVLQSNPDDRRKKVCKQSAAYFKSLSRSEYTNFSYFVSKKEYPFLRDGDFVLKQNAVSLVRDVGDFYIFGGCVMRWSGSGMGLNFSFDAAFNLVCSTTGIQTQTSLSIGTSLTYYLFKYGLHFFFVSVVKFNLTIPSGMEMFESTHYISEFFSHKVHKGWVPNFSKESEYKPSDRRFVSILHPRSALFHRS